MWQLFMKGGPLMWPLLTASLIALTTVIERILVSIREKRLRRPDDIRNMLVALRQDEIAASIEAGEASPDFRARCLAFSLRHVETGFALAFQHQAARELKRLNRGAPVLDTIITLAPLMGLLGTVTGMIHAFGLMGANELEAPAAITGGIAEALLATAFGLGIAIASLIPFNWLNAQIEKAQHELQDIGSQAELLLSRKPNESPTRAEASRRDYAARA